MRLALAEAQACSSSRDVPVGAIAVYDGAVIARGRNRREAEQDPCAHAELIALRPGSSRHRKLAAGWCDSLQHLRTLFNVRRCDGSSPINEIGLCRFRPQSRRCWQRAQSLTTPFSQPPRPH